MAKRTGNKPDTTWLAWAGWRLRIPSKWRPVNIKGEWIRGEMLVGDGESALLQLKWWRPEKRFRPEKWIRRRLRRLRAVALDDTQGIHPEGFDETSWAEREDELMLWYGFSDSAHLLLEAGIRQTERTDGPRVWQRTCLPSLAADSAGEPVHWSIFGSSFVTPPEFKLQRSQVNLGDIALCLTAAGSRRLVVRQAYPGSQALERRSMEVWLKRTPFKERKVFRSRRKPENWSVSLQGVEVEGLLREGVKRLRQPVGLLVRKHSIAAAVHDTELDRLLIAEIDGRERRDRSELEWLLQRMNWALDEREVA